MYFRCYRCGNVVDEVILLNRASSAGRRSVEDSGVEDGV